LIRDVLLRSRERGSVPGSLAGAQVGGTQRHEPQLAAMSFSYEIGAGVSVIMVNAEPGDG
jgi:hypothetical protein